MEAPTKTKRRSCQHCGHGFEPESHLQKYCTQDCAYGAQLRKMRNRSAEEQRRNLASMQRVTQAKPVVIRRARSLAETPDVPAQGIDRGKQLTGACSATIQADGPCR